MNVARRLLLVGSDHRFGQIVQTHLHKTFLVTAPVVRFDDLPGLVSRETDGLLLFLAADAEDADRVESAIRELKLQDLPPRIAMLEGEEFRPIRPLDPLGAWLEGRWMWPHQIKDLNVWVRRTLAEGTPFVDPTTETTGERIRRRLLGFTPSLAPMVEQMEIAAAHDVTVLIEGETGTGKTHLAKLIHDCSNRAPNRFLVVGCGALTGNLIASEFFGHVKGSFTGADATKVGKFAAAGEGTLLLDEIDTLTLDHQANLLRVIETGEYEPVGSTETQVCRARIVAATNWNLNEAVERGTFRRDLYYRLHVIAFRIPPLRERPQDIGPLVRGMMARYSAKFGKKLFGIHPDALRAMEAFPWPGNIRQLENVIQQSVLTATGSELRPNHLPPAILVKHGTPTPVGGNGYLNSLAQNRESTERAVIIRALEKVSFSRTRAAAALGVSRVTLYKKMKKYGLLQSIANPISSPIGELLKPAGI
ncbi:MAG TPA: sigma 54-interacting transcriptional regulator [Fimbriiglobus sp.]|jgi:DNA-binding NtrC family response regulator